MAISKYQRTGALQARSSLTVGPARHPSYVHARSVSEGSFLIGCDELAFTFILTADDGVQLLWSMQPPLVRPLPDPFRWVPVGLYVYHLRSMKWGLQWLAAD